jgi:polar amino acid transport system substrate-binding protein
VTIEWVQGSFGQLIPMLRGGEVDLVAAGMFITPERCELASFSEPTYVVGEALLVKAGNPKGLANFQSVSDRADAKVGLISGTVEYNYALVTGIPADRAPLYVDLPEAVAALEAGEVDAVAMTSLTAKEIVAQRPQLESTPQFFPRLDGVEVQGYGGFVFRLEDSALRDAFQAELASFIGSEAHWELVAPFGFTPEMAPDKNTESLCVG